MAAVPRHAFAFLLEGARFRAGRLYETFWNSQSNLKYFLVGVYPGYLFYIRFRAETQYKYNVYIAEKEAYPAYQSKSGIIHLFRSLAFGDGAIPGGGYWSNGKVFYAGPNMTVDQLTKSVYESEKAPPANLKVGCKGRVFENTDNLALAVKSFCRRDPRILMWTD